MCPLRFQCLYPAPQLLLGFGREMGQTGLKTGQVGRWGHNIYIFIYKFELL